MTVIGTGRTHELTELVERLRVAARTIRSQTLAERRETCESLAGSLHDRLEPHASLDAQGLEALDAWTDSLADADPTDPDLLQELLYGIDALVRVHLWRETGLPLAPPGTRSRADL